MTGGELNTALGDLLVIGNPPAKLWKALAVIADGLHPGFDADPRIITGKSKNSCVLTSLAVRDFLRGVGFVNARAVPVTTVMWAEKDGKTLHSLGIGGAPVVVSQETGRWNGHMVASVLGYVIDTTLYDAQRPAWPDLPGMIALPIRPADNSQPKYQGLDLLTGIQINDTEGYSCEVGWFDNPRNTSWRNGGDCERERRQPTVQALIRRFGAWRGA